MRCSSAAACRPRSSRPRDSATRSRSATRTARASSTSASSCRRRSMRDVVEADERVTRRGRGAAAARRGKARGRPCATRGARHRERRDRLHARLPAPRARAPRGGARARGGLPRSDRLARGLAAHPPREPRRHDGRGRLPLAAARALRARVPRRARRAPRRRAPRVHAEQWRAGRAGGVPRLQCGALGSGRRPGGDGAHRRRQRPAAPDRLRHGRHLDGRRALRRRPAPALRDAAWRASGCRRR